MRKSTLPGDTSLQAAHIRFGVLQELTGEDRLNMAFELSSALRQTIEDGVRHRHPDYDADMVKRTVLRLTLGEDLFGQVFGNSKRDK